MNAPGFTIQPPEFVLFSDGRAVKPGTRHENLAPTNINKNTLFNMFKPFIMNHVN